MSDLNNNAFDIYVHWLIDEDKMTQGTVHSSAVYDGVVPVIGDIIAVKWEDDDGEISHDATQVVERYNIDHGHGIFWHIVLKSIDLPPDRANALGLDKASPKSDDHKEAVAPARAAGEALRREKHG